MVMQKLGIANRRNQIDWRAQTRTYLVLFLMCGTMVFSGGCSRGFSADKLDAEELGYDKEFNGLITKVGDSAYQLWYQSKQANIHGEAGDKAQQQAALNQMNAQLTQLRNQANTNLAKLQETLPPEALAKMHEQTIVFLEQARTVGSAAQFTKESLDYHTAVKTTREELDRRPARTDVQSKINLVIEFELGNGFKGGVDIRESMFYVKTPAKLPGADLLSKHEGNVANKLIISCGGKKRYFSLDRQFQVFVPTDVGVTVSNMPDTIVITVLRSGKESVRPANHGAPPDEKKTVKEVEPPIEKDKPVNEIKDVKPKEPVNLSGYWKGTLAQDGFDGQFPVEMELRQTDAKIIGELSIMAPKNLNTKAQAKKKLTGNVDGELFQFKETQFTANVSTNKVKWSLNECKLQISIEAKVIVLSGRWQVTSFGGPAGTIQLRKQND